MIVLPLIAYQTLDTRHSSVARTDVCSRSCVVLGKLSGAAWGPAVGVEEGAEPGKRFKSMVGAKTVAGVGIRNSRDHWQCKRKNDRMGSFSIGQVLQ